MYRVPGVKNPKANRPQPFNKNKNSSIPQKNGPPKKDLTKTK